MAGSGARPISPAVACRSVDGPGAVEQGGEMISKEGLKQAWQVGSVEKHGYFASQVETLRSI